MLGFGLGLTHFGTRGGVSDTPDSSVSGAALMLASEPEGFAIDFSDASICIKDLTTPANSFASQGTVLNGALVGPGAKITYASPSPKLCKKSDGTYGYRAQNLYLNSESPANQSVTVVSGLPYIIAVTGTVSITLSGAAIGTVTAGNPITFTASTGTLTCGSTSGAGTVHLRSTIAATDYIKTTTIPLYDLPYDWTGTYYYPLAEPAATNLGTFSRTWPVHANYTGINITRTQVTGIDGETNSAYAFEATASPGAVRCTALDANTNDTTYTRSLFIKRLAGSGPVYVAPNGTYGWKGNGSETVTGSNKITNGDFTSNVAGWTVTGTPDGSNYFTWNAGGYADLASTGVVSATKSATGLTIGKVYRVSVDVTVSSGALNFSINGTGAVVSASGTYHILFMADASSRNVTFLRSSGNLVCTIDNVVVQEVTSLNLDISSQLVTGEWKRVVLPPYVAHGGNNARQILIATSGDKIAVDQHQIETGSVATSPIITASATVTWAADQPTIPTSAFPDVQAAITLYTEAVVRGSQSGGRLIQIDDGTANELHRITRNGTDTAACFTSDGGSGQASIIPATTGALAIGATVKAAYAVQANSAQAAVNGTLGTEDTSLTMPTTTTLRLGHANGGGEQLAQHIKRVMVLPRRMSNAELQALTA